MGFRTKLDFSSNRQAKQDVRTIQVLSGTTTFGVPFSALTTGPDLSTSAITSSMINISSTFSGNNTTTIFNWYNPNMALAEAYFSSITPSNSATTQNSGPVYTNGVTTIIDGNTVNLTYTGVSFDISVSAMTDLGGGNYSGTVNTFVLDFLSASTLDFTGRTIWVDVSGITRTEKLIITNNPQPGYVLTCLDSEGLSEWQYNGSSSGSTIWTAGTGMNSAVLGGSNGVASNNNAVSEGYQTTASGIYSHSEGLNTLSSGCSSHAEGYYTSAVGFASHAEGGNIENPITLAFGESSHAEGVGTTSYGCASHAEGSRGKAFGDYSHAEGRCTISCGNSSHAEGISTTAYNDFSHAEGYNTITSGCSSHAEGYYTIAYSDYSHVEGYCTSAIGDAGHAEGHVTIACGNYSHAEGIGTTANGEGSHAEGYYTIAYSDYSHAEGDNTEACGYGSHAGGLDTIASGYTSFVHGNNSCALSTSTIVLGDNIVGNLANVTYVEDLIINNLTSTDPLATDANGMIVAGTSDIRLKQNINQLNNSLSIINKLRGVSFEYTKESNMGDGLRYGFIAQEVQQFIPEIVRQRSKTDGMLSLNYTEIIPLLVEAIKELSETKSFLETQTILAEDNNIELNYNGTQLTSVGGGLIVLHAISQDNAAELKTDSEGNWLTNNDLKPKAITIPLYTPTSSNDEKGNDGNITRDDNYLYIKTTNKWKRINLEDF
jgi:hypothetical protein